MYKVEDKYRGMIVEWSVEEMERAEHGERMIDRIRQEKGIDRGQLTLHTDNGAQMKGATMLETLERLEVEASYSRPAVSDATLF